MTLKTIVSIAALACCVHSFGAGRNIAFRRAVYQSSAADLTHVGHLATDGKVPDGPEVFANLYNNQWNTNYPLWIPGSWSASLRVYPVAKGADEEQAIFTPAWEIRQPCVAAFAEGGDFNTEAQRHRDGRAGSPQPAVGAGVALSRKGVRLTAFCPNPDGDGIVLRVWEQSGVGGEITVSLPSGMKATEAQPVNLRGERAGNPIPVKDGRFSFELNAWSPKSFIIIIDAAMKNICQGNSGAAHHTD